MSNEKRFLLDTNVFIEAKRFYYAFDICPGFWASLENHHEHDQIISIDRVKGELKDGKDDLCDWAEDTAPPFFFVSTDEEAIVTCYQKVQTYVNGVDRYTRDAKAEFADGADAWLIAYAKVNSMVLVTREQPAPESKKKVKIPDVCSEFGVPYVDTFQMLRELGIRFDWSPS